METLNVGVAAIHESIVDVAQPKGVCDSEPQTNGNEYEIADSVAESCGQCECKQYGYKEDYQLDYQLQLVFEIAFRGYLLVER